MGGIGSGNHGGKTTVEGGLRLSLGKLIRDRLFRPGEAWGGSIVWVDTRTGKRVATIDYEAHMTDAERSWVRLRYAVTRWNGETHNADYRVALVTTPQPFGGQRWWFVCPKTGRRAGKLYLPSGAVTFASRHAYRLAYSSQRAGPRDRALNRAFRLRERLGSDGGIGEYVEKPKWMRWRTFDRLMAELEAAEGRVNQHTLEWLRRTAPRHKAQRRKQRA